MAYTIGFVPFDLARLYSATLPILTGILDVPASGPMVVATGTTSPFAITFGAATNPPSLAGTLLLTDPSGPGDFFRSGTLATWPAQPASVQFGTMVLPMTYAALTSGIPTPVSIAIPGGVTAAVGAATGLQFLPFNITITSLSLGPSPTPGAIRARFRGTIGFFTFFVPRRTDVSGTVDLTLTPSGDAATAGTLLSVSASNLSLSPGFITPLSTPALALLAPVFSGALSGPLTTRVNSALAPLVATARAMLPLTSAGTPIFSAAATVSVRRIVVSVGGVGFQVIMGELISLATTTPAGGSPGGPGSGGPPGSETHLVATIEPAPELDVARTYTVRVRRESDLAPVEDATVTIGSFMPVTGASVSVSAQTDDHGVAALDATLRARYRPGIDPTHTGELRVTLPTLTVSKQGYQTETQELTG